MADSDLLGLVRRGQQPDPARRLPALDVHGGVVPYPGESVLVGRLELAALWYHWDRTAKTWNIVVEPQRRAQILVTSHRVIALWPRFRADPALRGVVEPRVLFRALDGESARDTVLAGQVPHRNVATIFVRHPTGLLNPTRAIRFAFYRDRSYYGLELRQLLPDAAAEYARTITRAFSAARLAAPLPEYRTDDAVATLHRNSTAPELHSNNSAEYYDLPLPLFD